ncbi:unnamed protein product [Victoria cruziana]
MDVHLRNLFTRFQEQFGSGPGLGPSSGTCLLRVEGINPAFIKSLFRAAAALYRTDPWKRFRPGHLFGVRVGKDTDWSGRKQLFPCVQFLGGEGGNLGLNMFRSEQDAIKMTGSTGTIRIPNVDVLRVTFEPESLLFPANRRMIASLSLEASGSNLFPAIDVGRCTATGNLQFRNPTVEELRFLYAFMKAIVLLHPLLQPAKEIVPKRNRLASFEPFIETVDVQWPPELAKTWEIVAVTVSHPAGQVYEERKSASPNLTPIKGGEQQFKDDQFSDTRLFRDRDPTRKCAVCQKDVYSEQALSCSRCRAVVYCGPNCQKQHWKETHKGMCGLYKVMMEREEELDMKIFVFPCFIENPCKWLESMSLHQKGMWRRICSCHSNCPFGLLPSVKGLADAWGGLSNGDYPPNCPFSEHLRDAVSTPILLSSWAEYYSLRSLSLSSPVAVLLAYPLTVYHILTALSISSKNLLLKGKEVVVHYLGPELELDWMPAFSEISHLLNGSGNLQIVMVGPEVPTNLSGTFSGISSRVRINFVRGLYQEEATYLPTPHVILALNSGLDSCPSWGGALDLIKSLNVPAYFTEYSELACTNAKQVLRGSGLHISYPVTPNPFRSPVRNQAPSSNLPSYSNGFIFGVGT